MARRRSREARERIGAPRRVVIAGVGPGDGTTGGRYRARVLREPQVPRVVDDFFLRADGPRLVSFADGPRVVVSASLTGEVERWFDLRRLARGVAADPHAGLVVFGHGGKELVGSRWHPGDGVIHLDPVRTSARTFLCDRAGDSIHAVDERGVTIWRFSTGRLVGYAAWDLPALTGDDHWVLRGAAAVPGTRAVVALLAEREPWAEREPYRSQRLVFTDPEGGDHRPDRDISIPRVVYLTGISVLPPGCRIHANSRGPFLHVLRPDHLRGAAVLLTRQVLRLGWMDREPRLLGMGSWRGYPLSGGCYLVNPRWGRPLDADELPESWREAPVVPRKDRRGSFVMTGLDRPRLFAGTQEAVLVEDTGVSARVTLLRQGREQVLADVERATVGGVAVDEDAGEVVACLLPRGRGERRGLAAWSREDGRPAEAPLGLDCWDAIQALSPDGSRVFGMKEDRGTLLVGDTRTGEVLHEVPGPPRSVQPAVGRRIWANRGGDTVYMAWRSDGENGEYSTRRVLLPEEEVTVLPASNLGPVAFDAGGRRAALVWRHKEVVLWDRDASEPVATSLDLGGLSVGDLAWTPDGRFLVVAPRYGDGHYPDPELWLWDVREGGEAGRIPVPDGAPAALAFTGDGRWLYLVLAGGAAVAWEAEAVLEEARRR
jgi:hypothetical protein